MIGKDILFALAIILSVMMSSCMGDGENMVNFHRVGVVRDRPMRSIYTTDDKGNIFKISSSDFEKREDLKDGYCCQVDFKTNFMDEIGDGVYKADIFKYDSVAVWPLHAALTDTSSVINDERIISLDFDKSLYLDGYLFMQARHSIHQTDQKDIFNLSYNPAHGAWVADDGSRVYDLYLRISQEGGTGDSTNWISTTAFDIADFVRDVKSKESAAGVDEINLRVNYPSGFNADTTACVWSATDIFTLRFSN